MRQKIDAVPKLSTERKRVEKKIDEADRVLELAEQQHEETTYPLHFRLDEIKQTIRDGDAAKRELVNSCADLQFPFC